MSLRERVAPRWIGVVSLLSVLGVLGLSGAGAVTGFPGMVAPLWLTITFAGIALRPHPIGR